MSEKLLSNIELTQPITYYATLVNRKGTDKVMKGVNGADAILNTIQPILDNNHINTPIDILSGKVAYHEGIRVQELQMFAMLIGQLLEDGEFVDDALKACVNYNTLLPTRDKVIVVKYLRDCVCGLGVLCTDIIDDLFGSNESVNAFLDDVLIDEEGTTNEL